jgi:hypothetical protein
MKGNRILLVLSLSLAAPAFLAAADVNRSWEELTRTIVSGKKVVVTRMNSAKVEGRLIQITADSITVQERQVTEKPEPRTVQRADVYRVRYADIRAKHAIWGMLIGAGAAAAIGGLSYNEEQKVEAAVIYALFFGLPIGAATGAALPIGAPIYEAEKIVRTGP